MNDLIDRQAAIDDAHRQIWYRMNPSMKERIDDWLKKLPSTEPQWIPCSERMPEEECETGKGVQYSDSVLVTVVHTVDEEAIVDYVHTVDGRWYSDTTDCFIPSEWDAVAWMPLPEPYEGDSE